jgi:hypothetical protein
LGAPFFVLAPFFEEAFSGATWAPCSVTAANSVGREQLGKRGLKPRRS